MDAGLQIVLSGALTFGVPMLIGLRELLLLKPNRGGGGGEHVPEIIPPPPSPRADQPTRPLPACLIPNLPPRLPATGPARELEPV
jgi:hypothetical protein